MEVEATENKILPSKCVLPESWMQVHGGKSTYASTQSFISTNLPCYKQWAVWGKKKKTWSQKQYWQPVWNFSNTALPFRAMRGQISKTTVWACSSILKCPLQCFWLFCKRWSC